MTTTALTLPPACAVPYRGSVFLPSQVCGRPRGHDDGHHAWPTDADAVRWPGIVAWVSLVPQELSA